MFNPNKKISWLINPPSTITPSTTKTYMYVDNLNNKINAINNKINK